MARTYQVINLKQPVKLFGFTIRQLIFLAIGIGLGFLAISKVPGDWKIGNLPVALFAFIFCVSIGIVAGFFTDLKPMAWWRNSLMYRLGMRPTTYMPRPEERIPYPSSDIDDDDRKEDEYFIGSRR
ncbi:MAG: hypothetical protein KIT34_14725 [Cyanobacteria bacterium TGS_CYA1]|nr:hypothetical protein [Cyanobacteria bacterium TGS_CYA1]MDX2106316.1 hypothetical protein [Candidatus Melainabacteria bacterium]